MTAAERFYSIYGRAPTYTELVTFSQGGDPMAITSQEAQQDFWAVVIAGREDSLGVSVPNVAPTTIAPPSQATVRDVIDAPVTDAANAPESPQWLSSSEFMARFQGGEFSTPRDVAATASSNSSGIGEQVIIGVVVAVIVAAVFK